MTEQKTPEFEVFGFTPDVFNCVPCVNAKRLLDAKKITYTFIPVADGITDGRPSLIESVVDELEKRNGTRKMSMPQIYHNGKSVGGFAELVAYVRTLR